MTRTQRTDPHRPGAIIPAEYTGWVPYSLPTSDGGWPIPAIGVDCAQPIAELDAKGCVTGYRTPVCPDSGRCCVASAERLARAEGRAVFGSRGKCGVCGACFVYGELFKHEPTGELVHMGHDCADKYEMMYDQSAWEVENGRQRAAAAKHITRNANDKQRAAFLAAHEGLEAALALGKEDGTKGERILADMAGRFVTYRELSDKQVAFALKLADEILNPKPEAVERHCAAPVGKGIEFEGEIVSAKNTDGAYGPVTKMTIKVTAADGATWLAWGTMPRELASDLRGDLRELRGRRVAVKATLERPAPRDVNEFETDSGAARAQQRNAETHFVFMRRPTARFADVVDHPRYEIPKCVIGEPCRIIKKAVPGDPNSLRCGWEPIVCDGRCKNVAKARKPRAKKAAAPEVTA